MKTDWNEEYMRCIFTQPDDDKESRQSEKSIIKNGEYKFDLTKQGERLQPIGFGYFACTDTERNFHSFTGKVASGIWDI